MGLVLVLLGDFGAPVWGRGPILTFLFGIEEWICKLFLQLCELVVVADRILLDLQEFLPFCFFRVYFVYPNNVIDPGCIAVTDACMACLTYVFGVVPCASAFSTLISTGAGRI